MTRTIASLFVVFALVAATRARTLLPGRAGLLVERPAVEVYATVTDAKGELVTGPASRTSKCWKTARRRRSAPSRGEFP